MNKILQGEKEGAVISRAVKDLFFIISTAYTLRTLLLRFVTKKYLKVTLQLLIWTFFDLLTVIPPLLMHRKSFAVQDTPESFLEEQNDPTTSDINMSEQVQLSDADIKWALEPFDIDKDYEFASILRETQALVNRRTRASRKVTPTSPLQNSSLDARDQL